MQILNGNNMDLLKQLPDNSVDSIVTDPPYGLSFMGKKWDYDVPTVELWKECLRVLKPGGHLLAFAGTRTQHRMAVRIEDAGFEIRDMIAWVYGSGFPKSRNIGKDMEKKEVGGIKNLKQIGIKQGIKVETGTQGFSYSSEYVSGKSMGGKQISGCIPIYEINNTWGGWGTALKPAIEPITLARKPIEGTVAENVLKWGTGGINIDESRVGSDTIKLNIYKKGVIPFGDGAHNKEGGFDEYEKTGRFPANLIHDNSEEVRGCFPETGSPRKERTSKRGGSSLYGSDTIGTPYKEGTRPSDNGGNASRFFKSIIYQAKASKAERNMGCEGLEEKDVKGAVGMQSVTSKDWGEQDQVVYKRDTKHQNYHPTVKPIALMEYLIKMVTKKGGIVLDPFMGSGTTGIAAKKNGYNFIGMEMDEGYHKIAEARINSVEETKEREVSLFDSTQ